MAMRIAAVAKALSDQRMQDFISHKDRSDQNPEQYKKTGTLLNGLEDFHHQLRHETSSLKRSAVRESQSTGPLFANGYSISMHLSGGISPQNRMLSLSVTFLSLRIPYFIGHPRH
ncbi:hypothetical protein HKD27_11400 [Gluconobacter sp. R75690]|uniref:hypothetical protein n=1 Tax=Gluconobacter TaxID=441 RepID=UPI0012DA439D|nr:MULTISPECIES: hypothetical protein [Gluconobacter]MBF0851522.1 hypothetical protein [Gluconobacter sp. R75690]MBF0880236.1 hypothetical protein [Gluconobacter sp. R75828]